MNQKQRDFLIDKLKSQAKENIKTLEQGKLESPDLELYIWKAIMRGSIKIKDSESIRAGLEKMAEETKDASNWLSKRDSWGSGKRTDGKISVDIDLLFELPQDYIDRRDQVFAHNETIRKRVSEIQMQSDSLIARIQLCSNKTLETLIGEIDDMGDISLVDTKLKALISPTEQKLIDNQ